MLAFLKRPYIMIPGLVLLGAIVERKFGIVTKIGLGTYITPSA